MNPPPTSTKLYLGVWTALMGLVFLNWALAHHDLGSWNVVAAMAISTVQMLLAVLFFMNVRYESKLTWVFVGAGFFWLGLMFVLTLGDYLTRASFQ